MKKSLPAGRQGKVFLIGAGPGDAGLLTLKGKTALETSDVIVYDFLVNPKILKHADEKAKYIYVGKSGASHTMEQDEINQLLAKWAKKGHTVARLKGGDPFVFGRGGEEADHLFEQNIQFEIIPGVTSAIAGPSYAGIPITHRGLASAFTVLTGHKRGKKEEIPDIDYKKIANEDSTLVILMGLKNLSKLSEKLIQNGMPKNIPAAIISWATYNRQKTIIGTLADIAQKAKENNLVPPTIIVIGRVVLMRKRLEWFESRPLFNKKIVVTRTRQQASVLSAKLEALGAETIEMPMIEIKELPDSAQLKKAVNSLNSFDYIIFTSPNGAEIFGRKLKRLGKDSRSLFGTKICAIGSETAKELQKIGLNADIIPKEFVAEGILKSLPKNLKDKKALLLRAKEARDILPVTLKARHALVTVIPIYKTTKPKNIVPIDVSGSDIVTFTSSSCASNFFDIFKEKDLNGLRFASIGPITSKTIKDTGYNVWVESEVHTIDGLVAAITKKEGKVK